MILRLKIWKINRKNLVKQFYNFFSTDCSAVNGPTGLYVLAAGPGHPLVTFCDQDTGAGGWTVVQRRQDGAQEFNKKWQEYADGFGSPSGKLINLAPNLTQLIGILLFQFYIK